jgi:hypothetical protein
MQPTAATRVRVCVTVHQINQTQPAICFREQGSGVG